MLSVRKIYSLSLNEFVEEGGKKKRLPYILVYWINLHAKSMWYVTKSRRSTRYVGSDGDDRNNNNSKKPGRSDIFEPKKLCLWRLYVILIYYVR